MIPVGQGLFGECREAEKCICGLCADIIYGQNPHGAGGYRPAKPKLQADGSYRVPVKHRDAPGRRIRIKLPPRPRPLMGVMTVPKPCGCVMWTDRRVKWCYNPHTPDSHPNQ